MKRICCCFLLVLPIIFCACGKSQTAVQFPAFTCIAAYSSGDTDYEVNILYASADQIQLHFQKPDSLRELQVSLSDGETSVTYGDVRLQTEDLDSFPLSSFAATDLLRFLSSIGKKTLTPDRKGIETGVCDETTFELMFDMETGLPCQLSTEDMIYYFINAMQLSA